MAAMLKEQDGGAAAVAPPGAAASIKTEPPATAAIKEEPHENGTDLGAFDEKKVPTPLLDSKDNSEFGRRSFFWSGVRA